MTGRATLFRNSTECAGGNMPLAKAKRLCSASPCTKASGRTSARRQLATMAPRKSSARKRPVRELCHSGEKGATAGDEGRGMHVHLRGSSARGIDKEFL